MMKAKNDFLYEIYDLSVLIYYISRRFPSSTDFADKQRQVMEKLSDSKYYGDKHLFCFVQDTVLSAYSVDYYRINNPFGDCFKIS